jgi:hypothetical protein
MAINIWGGMAGVASRFMNPQPLYGLRPAAPMAPIGRPAALHAAETYRVLRAYYMSNGLYDVLQDVLRRQGVWREALKPLRNPTYRVVEFHAGHVWPGTLPAALPIETDNPDIVEPIQQVWKWSNWSSAKQVASRHLALYGDMFIKVSQTADRGRVFLQVLEPEHVTEFDADERDVLTYVRFDMPMKRRTADGTTMAYLHTEEWSVAEDAYRVWESTTLSSTYSIPDVTELGQPKTEISISSMGIDFVPVVHAKFADIGEDRGYAAIGPTLDKIDEANRQATRLAQLLFRNNNVLWALRANAMAGDNRPMPAPRVVETDGTTDDDGTIQLGDDRMLRLPGMSSLESLVPNINYEAALKILQDHMVELEQDLPELIYYRVSDMGASISGRAVRMLLAPAISRTVEARGNAENALIRADQMALTMGQNANLWDVGNYAAGDFEHCFEERDVLPNDELERAQAQQADGNALAQMTSAGMPLEMAVQEVFGWSEERAAQFTEDRLAAIQREQALAQSDVPADPTIAAVTQ